MRLLLREDSRVRLLLLDRLSEVRLLECSLLPLLVLVLFLEVSCCSDPPAEELLAPLALCLSELGEVLSSVPRVLCRGLGLFDDRFLVEDGVSYSFKPLDRLVDLEADCRCLLLLLLGLLLLDEFS